MSICVNINSKEFKDTSKRLDIVSSQLENIVHEYINQEGVSADSFPSDDYILSKTRGQEGVAVSEAQYKLWEQQYQKPIEASVESNWQYLFSQLETLFPKEMIGVRQDNEGILHVTVAKPVVAKLVTEATKQTPTSAKEMFATIKYSNSAEAELAKQVFDVLDTLGIQFVPTTFEDRDASRRVIGKFIASEGVIKYNPEKMLSNTILHEAIHGVTSYYLNYSDRSSLPVQIQTALKELEYCHELLKQDFIEQNFYENGKPKEGVDIEKAFDFWISQDTYGLTSPAEMVAEISNPEFIKHIQDFDSRNKGKNIFQKLIDAVFKLLNFKKSYTGVEKTIKDALANLLQNPSKEISDRYALENRTVKENINKLGNSTAIRTYNSHLMDTILGAEPENLTDSFFDTTIDVDATIDIIQFPEGSNYIFTQMPVNAVFIGGEGLHMIITGVRDINRVNKTAKFDIRVVGRKWLSTHKFDVELSPNGISYIKNIAPITTDFTVFHYSDISDLREFTTKEDNYFSQFKGGTKNAVFFTDTATPAEGTFLSKRPYKYTVEIEAGKVKYIFGTKEEMHQRGSSYTEEVNLAEQEGYDAVRFIGLDDNQEINQNITVIFDPKKAKIIRRDIIAADNSLPKIPETPNERFARESQKLNSQIDALLDSGDITATEVRHLAEQVVYWISDRITDYLEDPSKLFTNFPEKRKMAGEAYTDEERTADIDKVKSMSRAQLVNFIGAENIINLCKESVFNAENNDNIVDDAAFDKADTIYDNFDALMKIASDVFLTVEDFSIVTNRETGHLEVNDQLNVDADNFNTSNEENSIKEEEGNLQEHWQVESRTIDVLSSMSQLVRQEITKCYQLKAIPDINAETGEPIVRYEKVLSEFGIAERVPARDATSSILRWTQGSLTLGDMIAKLQGKEKENPWISQIIKRLSDTSGKETDFQSQFFGVFCKHFQPYSVVIKEDGKYKSIQVNEHPALRDAVNSVITQYNIGDHPLFTNEGINKQTLSQLSDISTELATMKGKPIEQFDRNTIIENLGYASNLLGYYATPEMIDNALSQASFNEMIERLSYITKSLNEAVDRTDYKPFDIKDKNGIRGNLNKFLAPITNQLEDTAVSSFYDNGKMYQSYVTPSYMTKLMNKFSLEGPEFVKFMNSEYGQYEWFRDTTQPIDKATSWRNIWLRELMRMSPEQRKEAFKHKVQLNFNKHNYMRNMSDAEYTLSLITEYFSEPVKAKETIQSAWYRVPMLSNKPSSEFIKFIRYTGNSYKATLVDRFKNIFDQELSRIQTTEMRGYDEKSPEFINNFDSNGRKFMFLDFMNQFLTDKTSELGNLIDLKLHGKEALTSNQEARLDYLVREAIGTAMDTRADSIISNWRDQGIVEGAKQISGLPEENIAIENALREFIWNDAFAAMNILQLTVTDIAYYKDAEDLQKRLAQIHAPGIRGNADAVDYDGNRVTDGFSRTFYLTDFDDFISNIKDNVRVVFERKQDEFKKSNPDKATELTALKSLHESIISQFDAINVADAEAYSSPTSFRKKAFVFGKWSRKSEEVYQKLKAGTYNYADLEAVFGQPQKPFVYSQIEKSSGVSETPLSKLKVPVQNKNSEYLLIMADAILQGEDTGRPNLLRAIYEVMEESAADDNTRGIDTIQFESTVKSGLMGRINIKQFSNVEGGEALAKIAMTQAIYNEDGTYNDTFVHTIPFEDYCIQQEVPEHFLDHAQAHGSQIRYIIPSDLESVNHLGEEVRYTFMDRGVEKSLTADEFKREYEANIAANIEESINELSAELDLNNTTGSLKERNLALSRILQREILSSPRYGIDLLQACSVDENGNFRIPLGDPVQSKRVEQLINSILKNRINKQEIAGGPVVQVTNFGTSRELNIRFKDRKGELLKTRAEFEGTDSEYRNYIKENQAGIAYFECFAPIYTQDLFKQFADENGNIDIDAIETVNPDLLKMIGYRIPTEDKYSMAPMKIVGFLPREAGDGIMLPNDITLLTGSDFDVDKFYLMRKEYMIGKRFIASEEDAKGFITSRESKLQDYLFNTLRKDVDIQHKIRLDAETKQRVEDRIKADADEKIKAYESKRDSELSTLVERYNQLSEENEAKLAEEQLDKADDKLDKWYSRQEKKINEKYGKLINDIKESVNTKIFDAALKEQEKKFKEMIREVVSHPFRQYTGISKDIKTTLLSYVYDIVEPTQGRAYRNNKIVDMTYSVLTNETTADKMLNPGGFDQQKRMGYMVTAFRSPANKYTWEQLSAMSIKDLKSACYTAKNLSFIDTHVQFYKQNSAAGQILGMFAVQKVAHAVLESNGYLLNIDAICNLAEDETFTIAGMEFGGEMEFDTKYDKNNQLIGKTLGSLVASAADAVKDPVLNLMNINGSTANVLNTLIRLGMPFNDAALLLSQTAISEALNEFNSRNIKEFVRFNDIIQARIQKLSDAYQITEESDINKEELTRDELIRGLVKSDNPAADAAIDYKALRAYQRIQQIADAMRGPTYATRFNSISNAVGPLIIDNLIMEHKMDNFSEHILQRKKAYQMANTGASVELGEVILINGSPIQVIPETVSALIEQGVLVESEYSEPIDMSDIFEAHPILNQFSRTVGIARDLFRNMPANSYGFRNVLDAAPEGIQRTLYGDRKALSTLSDFFQSYALVASGAINSTQLRYYIEDFPGKFMQQNYKTKYPNNPFIQAIKLDTVKVDARSGQVRPVLKIDTTGMDIQQKERLMNGWIDFHKAEPKASIGLFKYNFFRTGIGFSPKSFMGLIPLYVKERIPKYVQTYRSLPSIDPNILLDQFVRNNWDDNKLVPRMNNLHMEYNQEGPIRISNVDDITRLRDVSYFKTKVNGADKLFKIVSATEEAVISQELQPLGNNGEYLEISLSDIKAALNAPTLVSEQRSESEVAAVTPQATLSEQEVSRERTKQEQKALCENVISAFMTTGRTREESIEKIKSFKERSAEEKEALKSGMRKFLANKFEKLGIKFDERTLEESFKLMC